MLSDLPARDGTNLINLRKRRLRVGTLNCRTLRKESRMHELIQLDLIHTVGILAVQETRLNSPLDRVVETTISGWSLVSYVIK